MQLQLAIVAAGAATNPSFPLAAVAAELDDLPGGGHQDLRTGSHRWPAGAPVWCLGFAHRLIMPSATYRLNRCSNACRVDTTGFVGYFRNMFRNAADEVGTLEDGGFVGKFIRQSLTGEMHLVVVASAPPRQESAAVGSTGHRIGALTGSAS